MNRKGSQQASSEQATHQKRGRQSGFNQKRVSCPWINGQIIAASEVSVAQLLATVEAHLPSMNLVNLSTSMHRIAKVASVDPNCQAEVRESPVLYALLHATSTTLVDAAQDAQLAQTLSNVVWSLATLRLMHPGLLELAAGLSIAHMQDFKPFELSSLLWGVAKLGVADSLVPSGRPLFRAASVFIVENRRQIGFRSLATIAWAFATARQHCSRLFRTLALEMRRTVQTANCQEMANTVWAFGTVGHRDDRLSAAIAETALEHLHEFKAQELSNTLWGFASNDFYHEGLFDATLARAGGMDLQAQHLANILWACARLRPRQPSTRVGALSLLPRCTWLLRTFKPQEVSSTALAVAKIFGQETEGQAAPWSLSQLESQRLHPYVTEFFAAVTPWAESRAREFSEQSLANMVSAYAMLGLGQDGRVLEAMEREALRRAGSLSPSSLVLLLRAFLTAPFGGRHAVSGLAAGLACNFGALDPQDLRALARGRAALRRQPQGSAPQNAGQEAAAEELYRWCLMLSVDLHSAAPQMEASANRVIHWDQLEEAGSHGFEDLAACGGDSSCAEEYPGSDLGETTVDEEADGPAGGSSLEACSWFTAGICVSTAETLPEIDLEAVSTQDSLPDTEIDELASDEARKESQLSPSSRSSKSGGEPAACSEAPQSGAEKSRRFRPAARGRQPDVHSFSALLMQARSGLRLASVQETEVSQSPQEDKAFTYSVKNSFLHVEIGPGAFSDDEDGDSTADCGSSVRSSSAPSRFSADDTTEERGPAQQDWDQYHLGNLKRLPSLENGPSGGRRLPTVSLPGQAFPQCAVQHPVCPVRPNLGMFNIVIGEGDELHCASLRRLFTACGVPPTQVHKASSLDEAVFQYEQARNMVGYVVLGDQLRGGGTPTQCAGRLLQLGGSSPPMVDLITRQAESSSGDSAAHLFDGILRKPVCLPQLAVRLQEASRRCVSAAAGQMARFP